VQGVNPVLPPSNLTGTLQAGPQVLLTFTDNATNETGFVIERSTGGVAFVQIALIAARANTGLVSFTDTTVPVPTVGSPDLPSNYRVTAISGPVSSAPSNTATVPVKPIPIAPTNLNGSAVRANGQSDTVTLTWTDNADNETGFQLQRSTDPNFVNGVSTTSLAANATTTTQTGLTRGVTYNYRIRAINLTGGSAWSNVFAITTP